MAEAPALTDDDLDGAMEAEPVKRRRFSKKMLLIGGAMLFLIAGGIAAFVLVRRSNPALAAKLAESAVDDTYIDMPILTVNLRSADGIARLIKLHLMLVPASADTGVRVTAHLPLVIDRFQPFLRELRPDDLAGSAAVFRIKEELLVRANEITGAGTVKDVLIQDLIEQ